MNLKDILLGAALLAGASGAQAETLFTFENYAPGTYSSITQTLNGLTISVGGPSSIQVVDTESSDFGNASLINSNTNPVPYVADFSAAVTGVSLSGGDFGADTELILSRSLVEPRRDGHVAGNRKQLGLLQRVHLRGGYGDAFSIEHPFNPLLHGAGR